jgi:hypothetical protein
VNEIPPGRTANAATRGAARRVSEVQRIGNPGNSRLQVCATSGVDGAREDCRSRVTMRAHAGSRSGATCRSGWRSQYAAETQNHAAIQLRAGQETGAGHQQGLLHRPTLRLRDAPMGFHSLAAGHSCLGLAARARFSNGKEIGTNFAETILPSLIGARDKQVRSLKRNNA